jgi:hypothetical protein
MGLCFRCPGKHPSQLNYLIKQRSAGLTSRQREKKMSNNEEWSETLVEKRVTYNIEVDGRFVIIEGVPARVNVETGEKLFSPETVEHLQQTVWKR